MEESRRVYEPPYVDILEFENESGMASSFGAEGAAGNRMEVDNVDLNW